MARLGDLAAVVLAALAGGCLSTPSPASADAAGGDGGVASDAASGDAATLLDGGGADAIVAACGAGARPAATPWPPDDDVVVRFLRVADVDVDGRDDLVVAVAPLALDDRAPSRVYVMYGPQPAVAPYAYHVVVDVGATTEIALRGLLIEDLDADGCPELIVGGGSTLDGGPSRIAIWRHDGTASPWTGEPERELLGHEPFGNLHLVLADLSSEAGADLVVGNTGGDVEIYIAPTPEAISASIDVPRPGCDWDYLNHLRVVPVDGGGERVLAFGLRRWNAFTLDGDGVPEVTEHCVDLTTDGTPQTFRGEPIDLDGVAPDDIVVGGGAGVGVYVLTGTDEPHDVPDSATICSNAGSNSYVEGHAVGDLGGSARPEIVVIDHDDFDGTSAVCLVHGVELVDDALVAPTPWDSGFTPGHYQDVAIADVTASAAAEAWVIEEDGTLRCFQRGAAPLLEACE